MKTGDRVMLVDETRGMTAYPQVGTVTIMSSYAHVNWDDNYHEIYVPDSLRVVTGDDALPRHEWDCKVIGEEVCQCCGVAQTEENYLGSCQKRQAAK